MSSSVANGAARYAESHEYIRKDGNGYVVGITDFAQTQLGDVVFVEFVAEVGETVKKGKSFATVESVKAASDVYMPVDAKIVEVNKALVEKPGLINEAAMGAGWFLKVAVADESQLASLLDIKAYTALCEESLKQKNN